MKRLLPIGIKDFTKLSGYDEDRERFTLDYPNKEYLLPWAGGGKKLFKVGVDFDFEKRNIGEWKYSEE